MYFCTGTAELKLVTHLLNDTLFYCVRCNGKILKININAKYINIYSKNNCAVFSVFQELYKATALKNTPAHLSK